MAKDLKAVTIFQMTNIGNPFARSKLGINLTNETGHEITIKDYENLSVEIVTDDFSILQIVSQMAKYCIL